jgi:hypothetical protein
MLETEIKKLNDQIEQLNNNFAQFFEANTSTPVTVDLSQLEPEPEPEQSDEAPEVTKESLRDLCMSKVRGDKANKALIKKILSDLGAKLVDDLSENNLIKANEKIGAL